MSTLTAETALLQNPGTSLGTSAKPVIMCIDDHRETLDVLENVIREKMGNGYRVEAFETCEEALEVLQELMAKGTHVPAIICDQNITSAALQGDDFLIEAHKVSPATRKILLTGNLEGFHVSQHVAKTTKHASLYRFLAKPFDNTDVGMTVASATGAYLQDIRLGWQSRTLKTLFQATQDAGTQPELHSLQLQLMTLMMDFTGAETVTLALKLEDQLTITARTDRAGQPQAQLNTPAAGSPATLPGALMLKAAQQGELLVSADASADPAYSADAYVKHDKTRSLLLAPCHNLGQLIAVFCIESSQQAGIFHPEMQEIVNMLASTSATAIANAYMLSNMEDLVLHRTEEVLKVSAHKDDVIRTVSHDIRSPLSGVSGVAGLLQDDDIIGDKAQVKKYGAIIANSVDQVLSFVDDMLDLSKLQSGTATLNKEPNSLLAVAKGLVQSFESLTLTKGVKLGLGTAQDITAPVDKNKLAQSLNNLLSNAIKFTPKGGSVTLNVDQATHQGKPCARIQIVDTGIGIPKDAIGGIFDKFNKLQRSGTKGEKGTGLGMSIAYEIVQLHGGDILVDSAEGKGTTFSVLLPLA